MINLADYKMTVLSDVFKFDDFQLGKMINNYLKSNGCENPKEWEYQPVEEKGNDSYQVWTVPSKYPDEQESVEIVKQWRSGEFVHYSTHAILNAMCNEGEIPPGNYLVHMSY